jgi:hypothetical protein
MAAPFNPASVKSDNQPAALLEIAFQLQATELSYPEETRPNNVGITIDAEAGTATVTATLPVTFVADATGRPVIVATDYTPPSI